MRRTKTLTKVLRNYSNLSLPSKPQFNFLKIKSFHQITLNQTNPTCENPIFTPQTPPKSLDFTTVTQTLTSYNNDFNKALDFFNWAEFNLGFQHTTETFNTMIDILGKFFEFDRCWELIYIMQKRSHLLVDYSTFRIMFKRYVSAHYVDEAIGMFDKLDEFNLKDDVSFCNLLDALCEYKHVVEAEELWVKRRGDVKFLSETKVYNIMLRGYAKMAWWGKCRQFWDEMNRKGVKKDVISYSMYMDIQCKCGKAWKAVKLFKEMKSRRMKLDVVAYNTAIHAVGLKEGVDFSIRLFREMIEVGCVPNVTTYNTILKLLCEDGRMSEAYAMLNQMRRKNCEPDAITYHCFFRCIVKPGELLTLFERMLKSGVSPRMDTYVMLMRKFGRWGFLRPVLVVWDKMKELGCSPNDAAYNALIDALVQKGMIDEAKKYEEEMMAKGLAAKPRVELGTKAANNESVDFNCDVLLLKPVTCDTGPGRSMPDK